jgi:hypothetical protein
MSFSEQEFSFSSFPQCHCAVHNTTKPAPGPHVGDEIAIKHERRETKEHCKSGSNLNCIMPHRKKSIMGRDGTIFILLKTFYWAVDGGMRVERRRKGITSINFCEWRRWSLSGWKISWDLKMARLV